MPQNSVTRTCSVLGLLNAVSLSGKHRPAINSGTNIQITPLSATHTTHIISLKIYILYLAHMLAEIHILYLNQTLAEWRCKPLIYSTCYYDVLHTATLLLHNNMCCRVESRFTLVLSNQLAPALTWPPIFLQSNESTRGLRQITVTKNNERLYRETNTHIHRYAQHLRTKAYIVK